MRNTHTSCLRRSGRRSCILGVATAAHRCPRTHDTASLYQPLRFLFCSAHDPGSGLKMTPPSIIVLHLARKVRSDTPETQCITHRYRCQIRISYRRPPTHQRALVKLLPAPDDITVISVPETMRAISRSKSFTSMTICEDALILSCYLELFSFYNSN
ncbi:hypothetical protein VTO73DRAFT_9034 [Trametes versicolor]